MTPAPKHTPLPWHFGEGTNEICDKIGNPVCRFSDDESDYENIEENQKFIINACSNHDKLVEALLHAQWALQIARKAVDESHAENEIDHGLEQITAALAAVERE